MGSHFLDKITDEIWGKKCSVFVIPTVLLIFGCIISSTIYSQMSVDYSSTEKTVRALTSEGALVLNIIWICLSLLFVWYIVFVFRNNHIRGAKKGKTGIIIYYDCESKSIYKKTVRRLGEEFREIVQEGFDIIDAPYGIESIKVNDKNRVIEFLNKKKSILLISIKVNSNSGEKQLYYDMYISSAIVHPTYNEYIEKEFQNVFNRVTDSFRETFFSSKDMTKKMRLTANEMSIGCEYIIGLSYFLNGQMNLSEHICDALAEKLHTSRRMPQMLSSVNTIRYVINMYFASVHLEKYQYSCEVTEELKNMNDYLEKANIFLRNTFDYYLNKAYYYMAYEDDVKKASECINICKQKKNAPLIWKYSDAFLKAFANKPVNSILMAYRSALKVPYNTIDLIVFIEKMVEKKT